MAGFGNQGGVLRWHWLDQVSADNTSLGELLVLSDGRDIYKLVPVRQVGSLTKTRSIWRLFGSSVSLVNVWSTFLCHHTSWTISLTSCIFLGADRFVYTKLSGVMFRFLPSNTGAVDAPPSELVESYYSVANWPRSLALSLCALGLMWFFFGGVAYKDEGGIGVSVMEL